MKTVERPSNWTQLIGWACQRNPFVAQGAPGGVQASGKVGPSSLAAILLVALVVPVASAYEEAESGLLRPDVVVEGRHEPAIVQPHTQWRGVLVLRPGTPVVSAQYQVCRVGQACFAPPAPAQRHGDTFTFDTVNYTANGAPVDYQGGWRIGVQWILTEQDGNGTRTTLFPEGPAASDPNCLGEAQAVACQERHYIAFDMAPAPKAAPAPEAVFVLLFLLLSLGLVRRVRHRHG